MRLVVIALLLIATIWVIISGFKNQKRISLFAIFIFITPAGALGYFEYQWQQTQDKIAIAVQEISGNKEASFKCERLSAGFFDVWAKEKSIDSSPNVVQLKYSPCSSLFSWYNSAEKANPSEEQITAIHLLTKESMRVAGQNSDTLQECLAMKNDAQMARDLGASQNIANYVAEYYKQNINSKLDGIYKNLYC